MKRMTLFAAALLAATVAQAADVYKCTDAAGKVSFTDRPCPMGDETEALRLPGSEPAEAETGAARARLRACAMIARPAWDLQPRETAGQLTAAEDAQLREARRTLGAQCRQRLSASQLAFQCPERLAALTRATAAAVDPRLEGARDRLQEEYDRRCGEEAILDDIGRHLRAL
jgi:hypothetical protein